jgi:hypothetical protein
MPRNPYTPPEKVIQSCHEELLDMAGCAGIVEEHVLPTYVIGLQESCTGSMLGAGFTEMVGWKFVVATSDGHTFMADLKAVDDGADGEVLATTDSDYARKILQAVREIDTVFLRTIGLPAPAYDLRWLSIPSILVEGLWLHATEDGETSWVNPALSLCAQMRDIALFTFDDLVLIASQLGNKREAVDDTPVF